MVNVVEWCLEPLEKDGVYGRNVFEKWRCGCSGVGPLGSTVNVRKELKVKNVSVLVMVTLKK